MNKIGFIFSCLTTLIGAVTLLITSYTNSILPKIGYLLFNMYGGSYSTSNYQVPFGVTNIIAIVMILIGVTISSYLYLKDKSDNKR